MDNILKSRWFTPAFLLVMAASVVVVYSGTFSAGFHFDDIPLIVENTALRAPENFFGLLMGQRGVTMATFALNYAAGGLDVTGYHIVNTAIHIINASLAYLLLTATLAKSGFNVERSRKIAAVAALFFALHPIQTQSVTYIVQRMESLSALFYLAALLAFVKAAGLNAKPRRIALYGSVVVFYILGFYSKEVAVTLPAVIFLYDLFFISSLRLKALAPRWPLYLALVVLLVYFIVSTVVPAGGFGDLSEEIARSSSPISAGFGVAGISAYEYLLTEFNVIIYYIALLFVPVNQNLDYDFPISSGLFQTPVVRDGAVLNIPIPMPAVSLVIILMIIGSGFWLLLRSRPSRTGGDGQSGGGRARVAAFFIFWFFILLSPTSSFIPILDVIFEHRLYLASLGFFTLVALFIDMVFSWGGEDVSG
ncbi:TPR repeat-containing protein [hydrothermal vent metagenome]|uniref:TPR repeat-containing protein n=1 Tax=hydrothermal vent metagenome TaxID=652676 RepID=A0A3B0UWA7_9ZZZZ